MQGKLLKQEEGRVQGGVRCRRRSVVARRTTATIRTNHADARKRIQSEEGEEEPGGTRKYHSGHEARSSKDVGVFAGKGVRVNNEDDRGGA